MIITIASQHGAGKTTLIKELSKRFPMLKVLDVGKKFREMAEERGMSIDEFVEFLKEHPEESEKIDRAIDRWQKKQIEEGDIIVSSNIGAMLAKNADIKVLLICPLEVRARRVFKSKRAGDKTVKEWEEVGENLLKRDENDRKRYMRLYNYDMFDKKHYDIVLDSSRMSPQEEVDTIVKELKRRLSYDI